MTTHPNRIVVAICLIALMSTVGMAMPYPILAPIFVRGPADSFTHFAGGDPTVLMGIALAANPLGILLGSLFIGTASDRHGRRAVLIVTLLATLAGYLLTAAALAARSYPLFVLARFATGLAEGNVAVARALLADMHAQVDRTRAFAWLNACLYAGWLLGPLVGGLTLPLGEPVPFLLAGATMLPCLAVLARGLPADAPRAAPERAGSTLGLLRQDATLARFFALQLAYTLGLNAMYEYAPLWLLENAGLGSRGIGVVTAVQCGVMTVASVLAGRLGGGRGHPLRRAAQAALAAGLGLLALAWVPGAAGVVLLVLLGLPTALFNAAMPAWVSERFAAHGQGRMMGLLSTIFCIANVIVALAGGWIALLSTRWIMALGGLACAVSAALMLRLVRREPGVPSAAASAGVGAVP